MIVTIFPPCVELPMASSANPSSTVTRQLRCASAVIFAAAGLTNDMESISLDLGALYAEKGLPGTTMCSPPRTYPRINNYTRQRLVVPSAALASSKTKRRRSGNNDDGDEIDGYDGGFNGNDGGSGDGGDDGDNNERSPDGDGVGRFMQELMFLWVAFCAWSTWSALQMVSNGKPEVPCLATVSFRRGA